jgi:dihydrodipicolinate synthase/N-acetylneuraminate lyase
MDKNSERELSIKMSALGRAGSKARAASLSAKERKAIARKAARARWSKSKKKGKP